MDGLGCVGQVKLPLQVHTAIRKDPVGMRVSGHPLLQLGSGGWGCRPEQPQCVVSTRDEEGGVPGLAVHPRAVRDTGHHMAGRHHHTVRGQGEPVESPTCRSV